MSDTIPSDTPLKQCSKCPKVFPATPEYFQRDKSGKYGLAAQCKLCAKAYKQAHKEEISRYKKTHDKQYRDAHKEEIKRYRDTHKEEKLVYNQQYRKENRDALVAYQIQYNKEHAEQKRAYCRQYGRDHKESIAAYRKRKREAIAAYRKQYHKQYTQTEQGKRVRRAIRHRRRAIKKQVGGTYTVAQLQDQLKRQKYQCYYCRTSLKNDQWHADHIVPLTRENSSNSIDNIVIACPSCNQRKYNKLPHEWPEGNRLL